MLIINVSCGEKITQPIYHMEVLFVAITYAYLSSGICASKSEPSDLIQSYKSLNNHDANFLYLVELGK